MLLDKIKVKRIFPSGEANFSAIPRLCAARRAVGTMTNSMKINQRDWVVRIDGGAGERGVVPG